MPQLQQQSLTDPYAGEPVTKDDPILSDPYAGEPVEVKTKSGMLEPVGRFAYNAAEKVLPSMTPSDYIEGPLYAATHFKDAVGLLFDAFVGAHKQQAAKTAESAGRVLSSPTLSGKLGAASETLGHAAATIVPILGPASANAGEQLGSGDIAGGLGSMAGLLTPSAVAKVPVGKIAAKVGGRLHESAIAGVEKAINPTRIDTKVQTARIAPEVLKRRVGGGLPKNLQKIEELAETKSAAAGVKVDEALTPHKADTIDTMSLVDELEKAKEPYRGKAEDGQTVVNDPDRVKRIEKLQDTLMQYGDRISVESTVKLRRNWDRIVERGKGFVTDKTADKAWAAREGRSVLRDELSKAVPDLDKVNAEYAFWQTLEDVAHASNQRKTGQKGNLTSSIAEVGGAVIGSHGGMLQAVLGAKIAGSLKKFVNSPSWQLWSAVQKERLADALMAKDAGRVQGLIHQGMVAASKTSRASGRLQSGRPVPQAADATDREATPPRSARGTPQ